MSQTFKFLIHYIEEGKNVGFPIYISYIIYIKNQRDATWQYVY